MGQIERILTLYQRLMDGKVINKMLFAMEAGTTERSVERDILAIRLFLSESYSNLDLVYDRSQGGYRMNNLHKKSEIGEGECFILSKLLMNNRILRKDEQNEMIRIILSQVAGQQKQWISDVSASIPELSQNTKDEKLHVSLKLIEDLLFSIGMNDQILLHFGSESSDMTCVPYLIEMDADNSFLIALELQEASPMLFRLNDITSYTPARRPYLLRQKEIEQLKNLAQLVRERQDALYLQYVYNAERKE